MGEVRVEVVNDSSIPRTDEIVSVKVENPASLAVFDAQGVEIPSQVTYDGSLIFPATVDAHSSAEYTLKSTTKSSYDTIACGDLRPLYYDDIAWESDKIGYRLSAKPQLKLGKEIWGYDIFVKKVSEPVLTEFYDNTFGAETVATRDSLRRIDPKLATAYQQSRTYHLDHGKGMDYYTVGPTLGCGMAALVVDGKINYPGYYSRYEILDNGPLRFTLALEFDPMTIGEDSVTEKRIITLDAGSHFNKIEVEFENLTKAEPIIAGISLRDPTAEEHSIAESYITYAEPLHKKHGQTYCAVIFGNEMQGKLNLFDQETKEAHGGAFGHLQAEGSYSPNTTLSYYAGAGWNKGGFTNHTNWSNYVSLQAQIIAQPLKSSVK